MMEIHVENLKSLCRVCGEKITINKSYVNPKHCKDYLDIIQKRYEILFAPEDPEVCILYVFLIFICNHLFQKEVTLKLKKIKLDFPSCFFISN